MRRELRDQSLDENIPEAIQILNSQDPYVDEAMAVLNGAAWSFHWFPWACDDEKAELIDAAAVLEFNIHGVYGVVYFRDVFFHY